MEQAEIVELVQWKTKILEQFDTKSLLERIQKLENELEATLISEAAYKRQNAGYLGSDCAEVRRIEAELMAQAEGKNAEQRRAWLERQRKENPELAAAVETQHTVTFEMDDYRIKIEMIKKRLESAQGVLALKTAQIRFLS